MKKKVCYADMVWLRDDGLTDSLPFIHQRVRDVLPDPKKALILQTGKERSMSFHRERKNVL